MAGDGTGGARDRDDGAKRTSTTARRQRPPALIGRALAQARRITYGLPLHRRRPSTQLASDNPIGSRAAFARYTRAYFQRWLLIGALIGVVAGIGAIVFYSAIALCTHLFLSNLAGFTPPGPASEGVTILTPIGRRWAIPIITTLGGLITGLIVFTFAPEAEGHGTDAAIGRFTTTAARFARVCLSSR